MIRLDGVEKRFGAEPALRGVTFTVGRGEIVGFVGPNGAGKTTTLRIIAGFLDADAGRALVAGYDVGEERLAAQAHIGYLPEAAAIYPDMRVQEYLRFRARLKGISRRDAGERVTVAIEHTDLGSVRRKLVGRLSKGYRQRVGLADALLARPPILLLDEPAAGLDPVQRRELRGLLADLGREHTVLLSSHDLAEVEASAARVIVIVGGKIVADEAPEALRARVGGGSLEDAFVSLAEEER